MNFYSPKLAVGIFYIFNCSSEKQHCSDALSYFEILDLKTLHFYGSVCNMSNRLIVNNYKLSELSCLPLQTLKSSFQLARNLLGTSHDICELLATAYLAEHALTMTDFYIE